MRGAAETAGRQGVAALSTRKAIKYGGVLKSIMVQRIKNVKKPLFMGNCSPRFW
jgi:hypothetical protein